MCALVTGGQTCALPIWPHFRAGPCGLDLDMVERRPLNDVLENALEADRRHIEFELGIVGIAFGNLLPDEIGKSACDTVIFGEQRLHLREVQEQQIVRTMAGAEIDIVADILMIEYLAENLIFERGHRSARDIRTANGLGKINNHDNGK